MKRKVISLALGLALLATQASGQQVIKQRVIRGPGAPDTFVFPAAKARAHLFATAMASKYWIGASCTPASDTLKAQLRLDGGVAVSHVVAKSPAAKAGVKKHDIIVSFNDKATNSLPDLIKAVDAAKGKEATVKLVRAGKVKVVKVTPVKRPKGQIAIPGSLNVEAFRALGGANGPKLLFVHPGVVHPPQIAPPGTRVSVTRKNEKVEVVLSDGKKTYRVKSKKDLEKLPKNLRVIAARILNRKHVQAKKSEIRIFGNKKVSPIAPKIRKRIRVERSGGDKLDQVLRELKRLRKEVDALKRKDKGGDDDDDNTTRA